MSMRKTARFTIAAMALILSSCNLEDLLETEKGGPSTEDVVVRGLRTALSVGIDSGAAFAGKANGYLAHKVIKILLPPEAVQAVSAAESFGDAVGPFARQLQPLSSAAGLAGFGETEFGANLDRASSVLNAATTLDHLGDSLVKYMNRAAEYAAPRSVPIFRSAIASMTITDGLAILNASDSTAATVYLNGKTFNPLGQAYSPIVDSTLALVPLTRYWGDFRATYNRMLSDYKSLEAFQADWNSNPVIQGIPSARLDVLPATSYQEIRTESLGLWTTEKALTGLFWLVGEEEKSIRRDPFGYVKGLAADAADLLKEVFGDIMEMGSK